MLRARFACVDFREFLSFVIELQSSVKTFLPGLGNGWLKYCPNSAILGWAAENFERDSWTTQWPVIFFLLSNICERSPEVVPELCRRVAV